MSVDPVAVDAGCPWPVDSACFGDEWDSMDPTVQARSLLLASLTLQRLTGYRVGGCPIKIRPCRASCAGTVMPIYGYWRDAFGPSGFWPSINANGLWVNNGCGCATDCSCGALCEIVLPNPVGGVTEVKVNGAVVNPTNYRVDGNRLLWIGPDPCGWPTCQDLTKADTQTNTFSVTYLNSYPVDGMGAYAAGVLAMEWAKACTGNKACRLPSGVQSVARQGVSYTIQAGSFPDGFTGIREVDAYIALWNPGGLRRGPRVWSPDIGQPRVIG